MNGKLWDAVVGGLYPKYIKEPLSEHQLANDYHSLRFLLGHCSTNEAGNLLANDNEIGYEQVTKIFDGHKLPRYRYGSMCPMPKYVSFVVDDVSYYDEYDQERYGGCDHPIYWLDESKLSEHTKLADDHVLTHDGSIEPLCECDYIDCTHSYMTEDERESNEIVWDDYADEWIHIDDSVYINDYGTVHQDHATYVYGCDEYVLTNDLSKGRIDDVAFVESRDEYWHIDYCTWDDRNDEWVHNDDYEEEDEQVFGYHDGPREWYAGMDTEWRVGFEIEKEDCTMLERTTARELHSDTGWVKEHDGSLCSSTGFELISPTLDLFNGNVRYGRTMEEEFNEMADYINANTSPRCGGHINLSHRDMSNQELFNAVQGYMPMLYSLYPHRARNNSYASAKRKGVDDGKYSALTQKSRCIEFRIFGSVRSVKNLLWRTKLMQLMVSDLHKSEIEVIKHMLDGRTNLHKHLLEVYTHEQIIQKAKLAYEFARDYEFNYAPLSGHLHRKKIIKLPRKVRIKKQLNESFFQIIN